MQGMTRWAIAALFTMAGAQAQTSIPPFNGVYDEGFESHVQPLLFVCVQGGLFGGRADLCTPGGGGTRVVSGLSAFGCFVQPHTGSNFTRVLDLPAQNGTLILFNEEVQRFGGYFTLVNTTTPDFTVRFYSGGTQVAGPLLVSMPSDCQWHWAGWDFEDLNVDRIRIETMVPDGGQIAFDDLEMSPPACASTVYCTSKVNSLGCTPTISTGPGCPIPGLAYNVRVDQFLNNKPGILFYGSTQNSLPFQGGVLCVGVPIQRSPVQNTGGNPPPNDCSGKIALNIDTLGLGPGPWYFQGWSRDPNSPSTTSLSDAVMIP